MAIALVGFAAARAGADITISATLRPQQVQVGETASLSIMINGAQDIAAPALGNLNGFDARYIGPSTQISFVNGHMSSSIEHRYALVAQQPGKYTLGPFSVDYQGKAYQTPSFNVIVTAGAAAAPAPAGGSAAGAAPEGVRLTLTAAGRDVYLHERVAVDVTLYVGAVRVGDVQYPTLSADAFSLDKFPEPTQSQQVIDGTTYQVVRFQTTVIPLRAGPLTLGPASMRLSLIERRRGGRFDDPFFDPFMASRKPLDVRSEPVTINVLPLPDEDKPAGFSGAVGAFTLDVSATPTEVNVGDPVTVRMNVRGVGNLGDAEPPQLTDATGFRTYAAQPMRSDAQTLEATRSFEQVLIANDDTVREIPPVRFAYFDPQDRRYATVQSAPIALTVRRAPSSAHTEIVGAAAPANQAMPEPVGRDIVYIKDAPGPLLSRTPHWGDRVLWLWQPIPLLLFIAAAYYDRRRQRLSGDLRYARFTRAGRAARQGLATATHALAQGDRAAFYDAVSRTMQTYLGAKLDLPPGGVDPTTAASRALPDDCGARIREFFDTCERVRFAPGADDGDMRGTLALAEDIVKRLERTRWGALAAQER